MELKKDITYTVTLNQAEANYLRKLLAEVTGRHIGNSGINVSPQPAEALKFYSGLYSALSQEW